MNQTTPQKPGKKSSLPPMLPKLSGSDAGPALVLPHAPPAPPPVAPQVHPAQAMWQDFFAGKHDKVQADADKRMADASEYLHISGLSLIRTGKADTGIMRLRAATHLPPPHPQRYSNAAIALCEANLHAQALKFSGDGVLTFPRDSNLRFVHGNVLMGLERWAEAAQAYEAALSIESNHLDSMLNLGNCYRRLERLRDAERCYTTVIAGNPKRQDAYINLASLQLVEARNDEAQETLAKGRPLEDSPIADFMWSLLLLNKGRYTEGWDLYRRRHATPMAQGDTKQWKRPVPKTLDEVRGKKVLVLHEQGYGDSLQFCRYLSMMREVTETFVLVPRALFRLFSYSFPNVQAVMERSQIEYDFEIPMLDLPALFGTTVETIPGKLPYFHAPPMPERDLPAKSAERPVRIGLVWAGQARPDPTLREIDGRRSTKLQTFAPLGSISGVEWVSLQLGDPSKQLDDKPEGMHFLTPLDMSFDFMDSASVIKQLDMVISVDTAVAHLSAGLGVPTWILSRFDGCWRWFDNSPESPWYPEKVRVFGQPAQGDWDSVIQQVHAAVKERFGL